MTTEFNSLEEMAVFMGSLGMTDIKVKLGPQAPEAPGNGGEPQVADPNPMEPAAPGETKVLVPEGDKPESEKPKRGRGKKKELSPEEIEAKEKKEAEKAARKEAKAQEHALVTVREWVLVKPSERKPELKRVFPENKTKLTDCDLSELEQIIEALEISYERKK